MKIKTFGMIAAVVVFLFGLGLMLIPDTVMGLYGATLDESYRFVCRYFGSALFGMGVTWWCALKAHNFDAERIGVLLGAAAFTLSGLVISLWDALAGPANDFVWINPVLYGMMAAGFVFFGLKKTK